MVDYPDGNQLEWFFFSISSVLLLEPIKQGLL